MTINEADLRELLKEGEDLLLEQFDLSPSNDNATAAYGLLIELAILYWGEDAETTLIESLKTSPDMQNKAKQTAQKMQDYERLCENNYLRLILDEAQRGTTPTLADFADYPWYSLLVAQHQQLSTALEEHIKTIESLTHISWLGLNPLPLPAIWLNNKYPLPISALPADLSSTSKIEKLLQLLNKNKNVTTIKYAKHIKENTLMIIENNQLNAKYLESTIDATKPKIIAINDATGIPECYRNTLNPTLITNLGYKEKTTPKRPPNALYQTRLFLL